MLPLARQRRWRRCCGLGRLRRPLAALLHLRRLPLSGTEGPVALRLLAVHAAEGFRDAAGGHAHPRRVFAAVAGPLLDPLLAALAALRGAATSHGPEGTGGGWEARMLAAVEGILERGLFLSFHVGGYAAAAAAATGSASAGMAKDDDRSDHDFEERRKEEGARRRGMERRQRGGDVDNPRSYHRLLFEAVDAGIGAMSTHHLEGLGWLLQAYARALARSPARLTEAIGGGSGVGGSMKVPADFGGGSNLEGEADGHTARAPRSSALFAVFSRLLTPVQEGLLLRSAGGEQAAELLPLVNAMVALMRAARSVHAYVPSEDTLARDHSPSSPNWQGQPGDGAGDKRSGAGAATANEAPAWQQRRRGTQHASGPGRDNGTQHARLATALVVLLGELLELEYRVIEPHAAALWSLLLCTAGLSYREPFSESLDTDAFAASAALGSRLIKLYGEIRQVHKGVCGLAMGLRGPAGASRGAAALAASCSVLGAAAEVARRAPAGQVPSLLETLGADMAATLGAVRGDGWVGHERARTAAALAGLYTCVLDSVAVTAGNAVASGLSACEMLQAVLPLLRQPGCTFLDAAVLVPLLLSLQALQAHCRANAPPEDKSLAASAALLKTDADFLTKLAALSSEAPADANGNASLAIKGDDSGVAPIARLALDSAAVHALSDLAGKSLLSKPDSRVARKRAVRQLLAALFGGLQSPALAAGGSDRWDVVSASLTWTTYPIAQWQLLCHSADLWSPLASRAQLARFWATVLATVPPDLACCVSQCSGEEVATEGGMSAADITLELLSDATFYELLVLPLTLSNLAYIEALREAFAAAYTRELEKATRAALQHFGLPFAYELLHSASEGPGVVDKCLEHVQDLLDSQASWSPEERAGAVAQLTSAPELDLARLRSLLMLLGKLPAGYLAAGDAAALFGVVGRVERLLTLLLLQDPAQHLQALSALVTCRAAQAALAHALCAPQLSFSLSSAAMDVDSTAKALPQLLDWPLLSTRAALHAAEGAAEKGNVLEHLPASTDRYQVAAPIDDAVEELIDETQVLAYRLAASLGVDPSSLRTLVAHLLKELHCFSKDGSGGADCQVRVTAAAAVLSSVLWQLVAQSRLSSQRAAELHDVQRQCEATLAGLLDVTESSSIWGTVFQCRTSHRPSAASHRVDSSEAVMEEEQAVNEVDVSKQAGNANVTDTAGESESDHLDEREEEKSMEEVNGEVSGQGCEDGPDMMHAKSRRKIALFSWEAWEDVDIRLTNVDAQNSRRALAWQRCIGHLFSACAATLKLWARSCLEGVTPGHRAASIGVDRVHLMAAATGLLGDAPCRRLDGRCLLGACQYLEAAFATFHGGVEPPPLPLMRSLAELHLHLLGSMRRAAGRSLSVPALDVAKYHAGKDVRLPPLQAAARSSFAALVKVASRAHLDVVLYLVEQAILGNANAVLGDTSLATAPLLGTTTSVANPHLKEASEVTGSDGNGCVGAASESLRSAAAECLDITFQAVSGPWRLSRLASHAQAFLTAIFYNISAGSCSNGPADDGWEGASGSIASPHVPTHPADLLLYVKVMTTMISRAAIFPMMAAHVAFAVHTPWIIFNRGPSRRARVVLRSDDPASVDLFVACCKLLTAAVHHRLREVRRLAAMLTSSSKALLNCLGAPNRLAERLEPSAFANEGADVAVHCANWLRRVYEAVADQKVTLGKYCVHLLADYISLSCAHFGWGLPRNVEGSLKSGAFALMDACKPHELQQLYTALGGEGLRRDALLQLKGEYERRHKYTGKV
eukprot:SM000135S27006  [mRNA]  locus=s135:256716:265441:+ [translate_table: standard]